MTYRFDRIDNDGNYAPDNCHWVKPKINSNNKGNHRFLTLGEKTLNLTQWSERTGISSSLISSRIKPLGWTVEEALSTPVTGKQFRAGMTDRINQRIPYSKRGLTP